MERLERLARTLVRAADGIVALPPDTVWCLAVLVAAWWLRDREIGATYRLATAGLSAEPLFARLDRVPGLPDVAASAWVNASFSSPHAQWNAGSKTISSDGSHCDL